MADQQRVEEKNEKEEQSEESESVTDRSEEEMSDMMMHVAFEGGKESAKTYDPYFGMVIPSETEILRILKKKLGTNLGLKRTNYTVVLLWMRKVNRRRQSGRERLKRAKLRATSEKWIITKARLTKKGVKRKIQRRAKAERRRCEKSRPTKM